jgi:hypothetical protein
MADWADLTTASAYTSVLNALLDRTKALSKMALTAETSLPTGAMTAVIDDGKFQRWSGTAWADWQFKAAAIAADAVTDTKIRLASVGFLRSRNAANSADLYLLAADASDNTIINTPTGKILILACGGSTLWNVDGTDSAFKPAGNGTQDLGDATHRIRNLLLGTGISMPEAAKTASAGSPPVMDPGFNYISSSGALQYVALPAAAAGKIVIAINESSLYDVGVEVDGTDEVNGIVAANAIIKGQASLFWARKAGEWVQIGGF